MSKTDLLDKVNIPADLRQLDESDLPQFADELRAETISVVSELGGHLGAGLGVLELTVALHYIFNTPEDRLIWDVGHQAYPHKIITGRRDKIRTLRKRNGLSGFTKRSESEYDPFGAGHSSTSISAALGMAVARDQACANNEVIAVIGDGAMSAGMAYEALNNAGALKSKLIVILNDNDMSIAPPVGAFSAYLSRMISSKTYISMRNIAKKAVKKLPHGLEAAAVKTEQYAKNIASGGNFFEEMGFYYVGPIDGHNLDHLIPVLKNVRDSNEQRPVLIHVVTEKGKGFDSPDNSCEKFHAVKKFHPETLVQEKSSVKIKTYTDFFADNLIKQAEQDDKIIAITAAMPSGTGLDRFADKFPDRCYDVAIAEQHAVTFAAGLATEGYKPFVAIYSTFLQRAYDQIIHDVDLQKLPVRFMIDRAGLVGSDGATHAGSFDIAYLSNLPNMVVMAPSGEAELAHMVATASAIDDRPCAVRYPRGAATGCDVNAGEVLKIGEGRVVFETSLDTANTPLKTNNKIAILSLGTRLQESLKAAEILTQKHYQVTVADARFAKPFDKKLVTKLVQENDILVTIEEGVSGGFGAHILEFVNNNLQDINCIIKTLTLPDKYIHNGDVYDIYEEIGLNSSGIVNVVRDSE